MMTREQYLEEASKVTFLAQLVENVDCVGMSEVISRTHAIAPILDPTAYRNGMDNLQDMERLLAPLRKFQVAVRELKADALRRVKDSARCEHVGRGGA